MEEHLRNGNLLSNLTVENGSVKSCTKRTAPAMKKLIQFSRKMRRSTSILKHKSTPSSKLDTSKITDQYPPTPNSPPDLLLKMPLIPFWKTSLDLLSLRNIEDPSLRVENIPFSREAVRNMDLHIENNYMTMKNKNNEEENVIYI